MLPEVSEGQQHSLAQDHSAGRRSSQARDGLGKQAEGSSSCILEEQVGLGVLGVRWQSPGAGRDVGQSQGWVLLRQCSRRRRQALHLCLNGIAKANKDSWSLLTGRFTEMKSLHQVTCSCSEELKLCPRSGWIKSLTSAGI